MKPLPRSTAKDVFSHLLAIVTLYVGVGAFIALYFQYINIKLPDALQYTGGALDIIRQSMAGLIVVWPVYILMSWFINKDLKTLPEKQTIGIRKWLLYLTLFITALTIIIDLVTLVNYFLNGEITTRFVLKVLVVLLTAAGVFWYYLWDLRRDNKSDSKIPKIMAWSSMALVLASVVLGFFYVGSPSQQRIVRFDDQRINDLSTIQNELVNYYGQKSMLPATLAGLTSSITGFSAPVDPETKTPYEYRTKDKLNFELCAIFGASTQGYSSNPKATPVQYPANNSPYNQNWNHDAGHVCFQRTIDPTMFPDKKPVK